MREVDVRWLDYARDVVLADDHTTLCLQGGGGCLEPGGHPELRWPGYLGARYRPGGLLLVGNVHQRFSSNGVARWVGARLVDATQDLRADPAQFGKEYLDITRECYLEGLRGWNVAAPFAEIMRALGTSWDDVAYTNASKTQLLPGHNLNKVVRDCLRRFPISTLASSTLEASLVVTCSAQARDALRKAGVPCEYFTQSQQWRKPGEIGDLIERCRGIAIAGTNSER